MVQSSTWLVVLAVICVTLGGAFVGEAAGAVDSHDTGTQQETGGGEPHIVSVYPNPATDGDRGEFVTVSLPAGVNLSAYELADEQRAVTLSPRARVDENTTGDTLTTDTPPAGPVTFSTDPGLTEWLRAGTVAPLSDAVGLANSGESVQLRRNGSVVDSVRYDTAPEGRVYSVTADTWRPLGATDRPVVTARGGTVEAFVLPDEPDRAVSFLDSATERILLAGYTLTSSAVVDTLSSAVERGVTVEVLVDGSPIGGMSRSMATALSTVDRAGATVRVLAGDRARYRHHHPKYAVVDDRALVTTENWKPAGTGGAGSRGWAVITDQQRIVEGLADTYRSDTNWVDTVPWGEYEPTLVDGDPARGSYPQRFETQELDVQQTSLLVTPDNAGRAIQDLLAGARESIAIKQVSIGDRSFQFLQTVLDAAARGVEVRILLSGAWYVEEENRQLAAWLSDQAEAAELPLSVRIAEPGGAFEKIHAKGILVDGEHAVVGSINWNSNSVERNREVALLLEGRAVAGYFGEVFAADWRGDHDGGTEGWSLSLGLGLAVLAGAVGALLGVKRVRFD